MHEALDASIIPWSVLLCFEGLYKLLIHLGSLLIRFLQGKQAAGRVGWLLQAAAAAQLVWLPDQPVARTRFFSSSSSLCRCVHAAGGWLGCHGAPRPLLLPWCCCPTWKGVFLDLIENPFIAD
jgi:hypothetical protein